MKKIYSVSLQLLLLICVSFSSAQTQTPYASYPLDGNANDTTPNMLNGTIYGQPLSVTNRFGQNGMALQFNGSTDYIILPTIFDFPNRTIIVWFNVTQLPNGGTYNSLVYYADNANIQFGWTTASIRDSSGVGLVGISCAQTSVFYPIQTGVWYQVAMTRSPQKAKYFLNGVLMDSLINPTNYHSNNQTTFNAVVGADRHLTQLFNGKIDDLAIYDVVLPDEDIKGIYTDISTFHELDENVKAFASNGDIFVRIPENLANCIQSVVLYNVLGEKICMKNNDQLTGKINDHTLVDGTYIITVNLANQSKSVSRKVSVLR